MPESSSVETAVPSGRNRVSQARIGFTRRSFPGAGSISRAVAAPERCTAKSIRNRPSAGRYSLEIWSPASSHASLRFGIVTRSCGWSVSPGPSTVRRSRAPLSPPLFRERRVPGRQGRRVPGARGGPTGSEDHDGDQEIVCVQRALLAASPGHGTLQALSRMAGQEWTRLQRFPPCFTGDRAGSSPPRPDACSRPSSRSLRGGPRPHHCRPRAGCLVASPTTCHPYTYRDAPSGARASSGHRGAEAPHRGGIGQPFNTVLDESRSLGQRTRVWDSDDAIRTEVTWRRRRQPRGDAPVPHRAASVTRASATRLTSPRAGSSSWKGRASVDYRHALPKSAEGARPTDQPHLPSHGRVERLANHGRVTAGRSAARRGTRRCTCSGQPLDQRLHRLHRLHREEHLPQLLHLLVLLLGEELLLLARARLRDVDRREDALLGEQPVQGDLACYRCP